MATELLRQKREPPIRECEDVPLLTTLHMVLPLRCVWMVRGTRSFVVILRADQTYQPCIPPTFLTRRATITSGRVMSNTRHQ